MADQESVELGSFKASIIQQLEDLKRNCDSLQATLSRREYIEEYERYHWKLYAEQRSGVAAPEFKPSPAFSRHILVPFVELNSHYQQLKYHLVIQQYLTTDEIHEIEASILTAAGLGEDALDKMVFFPEFQRKHLQAAESYKQSLFQQRVKLIADMGQVRESYANKSAFYIKLHIGASFFSLIGIGLPILLGGLMAHLIEKLTTRAKLAELARHKNEKIQQIHQNIHPELDVMHEEIKQNEKLLLKQSFFSAVKARHGTRVAQLEQYFPKSSSR